MTVESTGAKFVGNPFAPEVFADEAVLFDNINGTIRMTFAAIKPLEPVPASPQQFVTVGRLIMTTLGAQHLCLALHNYLTAQGLDPSASVRGDQTAQ